MVTTRAGRNTGWTGHTLLGWRYLMSSETYSWIRSRREFARSFFVFLPSARILRPTRHRGWSEPGERRRKGEEKWK